MAEIIWTLIAKNDLVGLTDYIAFENPKAAAKLVSSVLRRIFYKVTGQRVYILHIMREEQQLRLFMLNLN